MTNLKATHPTIFCKTQWKKVPMMLLERRLYLMDVHTHTHSSHTHREICNHVLEGKKIIKRFKLEQKVKKKPQKVLIVASFEGDDEKA